MMEISSIRFLCSILLFVFANCGYSQQVCDGATYKIVESIPIGLDLQTNITTYEAWMQLFDNAADSIDIAQYYVLLTDGINNWPDIDGGYMGNDVFNSLIHAKKQNNVSIRIVQNEPNSDFPDTDSATLAKMGVAEVRSIDWSKLEDGTGILHTKLIVVDEKHVYIGSANFNWSPLAQVKEIGIVVQNCPEFASDVRRIFEMYWAAADMTKLPDHWAKKFDTEYNLKNPMELTLSGESVSAFVASSPKDFCPEGRTNDIEALLSAIYQAESSICIEVMDYSASSLYFENNFYWPDISNALTDAAFRNVSVQLLFAKWNYTIPFTFQFIRALDVIDNIEVRLFEVPPQNGTEYVPYTRVNHAKFMVTDKASYVGTSNWSADYFLYTGGVSFNANSEEIRTSMQRIFDRDWNSPFAHSFQ
eukprot:TRINITY_DN6449_c0_g1_i2.p1 TRINITY_DN6449_c0_g1~~TRINITY_DN6449_c0_g1_i2.p1  ORF type:complete len:418 (+),score=69.80 TRINITY_DN6449_c0_g1_i2:71-1324(+)